MNCQKWLELSLQEKIEKIGKITHLVQNFETGFDAVTSIIEAAEESGVFKEIVINPVYECKLCQDTKHYPNTEVCPSCVGRDEDLPLENNSN